MKKLIGCLGLTMALALVASGCTLYFGPDDDGGDYYSYCDDSGCYTCQTYDDGSEVCWQEGGGGCSYDGDCAAGCYCDEGTGQCIEGGFCGDGSTCPDGYTCDIYRSSCVPDGTTECWYSGCPSGEYCDQWSGECTPSTTCNYDQDCGPGWYCNGGTCNPLGCTSDDQCAAGCYCDPTTGNCNETSYCTADDDCPAGQTCDESRTTCVPSTDPPPPPPPPPPPACEELTDQASCDARSDCHDVWTGINCTPECADNPDDPACTCQSYVWDSCAAN